MLHNLIHRLHSIRRRHLLRKGLLHYDKGLRHYNDGHDHTDWAQLCADLYRTQLWHHRQYSILHQRCQRRCPHVL